MKKILVVFEGLDCSGKTTIIKRLLKNIKGKVIYNKGIGSETKIGRISRKFPSTLLFFIELIYGLMKSKLNKPEMILQDRYDISIISYAPLTERWYNHWIIKVFERFVPKPNAIVYLYLPLEERIRRLKDKGGMWERVLAQSPELIIKREAIYLKWYNKFDGFKIKINTKKNNIKQTESVLRKFIARVHASEEKRQSF